MSWAAPQAALLPDGKRLHLHHGPIDLIIGVSKEARAVCFARAIERFQTLLSGLATELDALRRSSTVASDVTDIIARHMVAAIAPHRDLFVTPMAAVAGAVADEVLATMLAGQTPQKAYVNNGGDIAFHLSDEAVFDVQSPAGKIQITSKDKARGIATSGWRGRSHSLGIADAVTVAAETAAAADVAATLIANAVDIPGHPAIQRRPADQLNPDSDLGCRLVTIDVDRLTRSEIAIALRSGAACASRLQARGLIQEAAISLQSHAEFISKNTKAKTIGEPAHA